MAVGRRTGDKATGSSRALSPRRRAELLAHLAPDLESAAASAAAKIDLAFQRAAGSFIHGSWLREIAGPESKRRRRHFERMAQASKDLLEMLDEEEPHGGMSTLTSRAGYQLSWKVTRDHLAQLAAVAADEAATHRRTGRPRETPWRDILIGQVWNAYPEGKATTTRGGHFEQTIAILLRWIGDEPEDVHDAVLAALRWRNSSPKVA